MRYSILVSSVNGPCRVWTVGQSLMAPMLAPTGPGVVVQQIELLALLVGRHGVGGLVPGVADQCLRRYLVQGRDQFGLGLGPRWANRVT